MRKKGIIEEHGINDMPFNWINENEWNKIVYQKWHSMLVRVYSDKFHETNPTYIDCTLQLELHWLSYFVENIAEIDGYNFNEFVQRKLVLDKDVKSNGKNKEYSIENCTFISNSENSKQAMKTRDYFEIKGENNPNWGKQLSEETRKKISEANKGKKMSETARNKISKATKGKNNPRARKVAQYNKNGELIRIWDYIKQASVELSVDYFSIVQCCRGKNKTAGGFIWRYVN